MSHKNQKIKIGKPTIVTKNKGKTDKMSKTGTKKYFLCSFTTRPSDDILKSQKEPERRENMLKSRLWRVTYDYNTGAEGGKIQEEFRKKETARLFISRLADFNGISNVQLKRVRA